MKTRGRRMREARRQKKRRERRIEAISRCCFNRQEAADCYVVTRHHDRLGYCIFILMTNGQTGRAWI